MKRSAVLLLAGACVGGVASTSHAASLTEILEDSAAQFGINPLSFTWELNDDSATSFLVIPGVTDHNLDGVATASEISELEFLLGLGSQVATGVFEISDVNSFGTFGNSNYTFFGNTATAAGTNVVIPEVTGVYSLTLNNYDSVNNLATFSAVFDVYYDEILDGGGYLGNPGAAIDDGVGVVGSFGADPGSTLFARFESNSYQLEIDWAGDLGGPTGTSFISAGQDVRQSLAITGGEILSSSLFSGPFRQPIGGIESVSITPAGGSEYLPDGYGFVDQAVLTIQVVPTPAAFAPAMIGVALLGLRRRAEV